MFALIHMSCWQWEVLSPPRVTDGLLLRIWLGVSISIRPEGEAGGLGKGQKQWVLLE